MKPLKTWWFTFRFNAQQLHLPIFRKKMKKRKQYQSMAMNSAWQILKRVHQQLPKSGENKKNLV